jgi:hypothetical protein
MWHFLVVDHGCAVNHDGSDRLEPLPSMRLLADVDRAGHRGISRDESRPHPAEHG